MWLHSELWRQDQDSVIGAVIKGPALLNPGNDLLEKDLGILDELVSSKEGSARDRVCQSSHDNNLTVLILAKQSSFQLHGIESWDEMRLTKTMKIRVCRLSGIQMTVDI